MKKSILFSMLLFAFSIAANAQRFALIDMEYILKNIPAYERANEQLNQISKKWQSEVETLTNEAQKLYKNYQSEAVFLYPTLPFILRSRLPRLGSYYRPHRGNKVITKIGRNI